MAPSLIRRLLGAIPTPLPVPSQEPRRLMAADEVKSLVPSDTKASLLPSGAYGPNYVFFSPDGGRTMFDIGEGSTTALAFIAYWYVATRWRAQKIAEAPLMVVAEDQVDGTEEWLPDHELVGVLDEPSPDFDMGELLECTSQYLDNGGSALWVMDRDRIDRIARIFPFSRVDFEPIRSGDRLFAAFRVNTANGQETFDASQCCFFRDSHNTLRWENGVMSSRSRLDVALSWLKLGARATRSIYDLLTNSVWPSAVIAPNKDWNPDPQTYLQYKQDIQAYGKPGQQGRPFVALGGATWTSLQTSIKDLVPSDILNRVESIVSAISGVPAIVLQFQVGIENSPWSQMVQARRMAYDDVIVPSWRRFERVLTRQMLRGVDDDATHFIRFDKTNIDSLKEDQLEASTIASLWGRAASLNERRAKMGLEPATKKQDPEGQADQIPELTTPSLEQMLAGGTSSQGGDGTGNDGADNTDNPDAQAAQDGAASESATNEAKRRKLIERKLHAARLQDVLRAEAQTVWQIMAGKQLARDADEVAAIVEDFLTDMPAGEPKSSVEGNGRPDVSTAVLSSRIQTKDRNKGHVMAAVTAYLRNESKSGWTKNIGPLQTRAAERATATVAADLGISYQLLHPNLLKFAARNTGRMIKDITETTRDNVSRVIQDGLEAGDSTRKIAKSIRESAGFSMTRARLIARTETTKAFNGAPQESLADLGRDTGRVFTKTWSGALDERERDEHVAMEGETVPIDQPFSNGLMYPSEPNCRCTALYNEEAA